MQLKCDTRVILVRHGQSTYNALGLYQGCCDESTLTDKGLRSAYETGVALRTQPIRAIYTSPLQRARATTREIVAAISASPPMGPADAQVPMPLVHPCLKEVELPAWQGLPFGYVRKRFQEDYLCWKERPHEFQMSAQPVSALLPNSDSSATFPVRDLYRQAQLFWQEVLPRHRGETILVVSHGGTIRALISTAIDLPCEYFHVFQQSNCGISMLDFPAFAQPTQLMALNLTHHLGEALPKLKEGKQGIRLLLARSDTQPMYRLTEALTSVSLDFCLNTDPLAATLIPLMRRSHPTTAVIEDLPSHWHRSAMQWLDQPGTSLQTGAIFANAATLETIISQMLGLTHTVPHLPIQLGSVGVVHYPSQTPLPIFQALNWRLAGTRATHILENT